MALLYKITMRGHHPQDKQTSHLVKLRMQALTPKPAMSEIP